jgi:serine/threonine-protein kinase
MSPEQATGVLEIDARSDVYALACVTYEMLAGQPPHTGPNAQAIIANVLTQPARSLQEVRKTVPLSVDNAVDIALSRIPADRWATVDKYAQALTDTSLTRTRQTTSTIGTWHPVTAKAGWRSVRKWIIPGALVLFGMAIGLGWIIGRGTSGNPGTSAVTRFTIPARGGLPGGQNDRLDVSPDGQVIAYSGREGLMIQHLNREEPMPVPNARRAASPVFSPDGSRLGFGIGYTFHQVLVSDGSPVGITNLNGALFRYGITWRDESTIIYVGSDIGLWEVSVHGGNAHQITSFADSSREIGHMYPQAFRDGQLVTFTVLGPSGLGYDAQVVVQNIRTGQRTIVAEGAIFGRYLVSGHIMYATSDGMLFAVPYDASREEMTGPPFPVESGIRVSYWGGAVWYAISQNGTIAFVRGNDWENHQLIWLDRNGQRIGTIGKPITAESVSLSPDGQSITLYLAQPGNADIYVIDAESGDERRITYGTSVEDWPIWSPDSQKVAYQSAKSAVDHRIEIQGIDGNSDPLTLLSDSSTWLWPASWSPDGQWIAFTWPQASHLDDIYAIQVDNPGNIFPVAVTPSISEGSAQFSPDSNWLAYVSDETGQNEVYVVSFPEIGSKHQISNSSGFDPSWSQSGDELFFRKGTNLLMVARVSTTGSEFRFESPQTLLEFSERVFSYSPTPDGQKFLAMVSNPYSDSEEIHIVQNWFEVVREKSER